MSADVGSCDTGVKGLIQLWLRWVVLAIDLKVPIALNSCSGNVPYSLGLIRSDLGVVTVTDWPLVGMLCSVVCMYNT